MAHLDCSFYSPSLRKNAKLTVFLPTMSADDYLYNDDHPRYFAPDAKYQTLYLLHGSYGDCMDWCLLANVERQPLPGRSCMPQRPACPAA